MAIPNLDRLLRAMRNVDDVDRAVHAAQEIHRLATPADIPVLRRILTRGDYFFRESLGITLAELEGPPALPFLLRLLREGQAEGHDHDGLAFAVTELVSSHPAEVLPLLEEMAASRTVAARRDAAWLWGFAAPTAPVEPLFRLARDRSPRVRGNAVGSLGSYPGRADVFDALAAALRDRSESVRTAAVSALGYYGDRRAIPLLEPFASRRSPESVRRIAEYALERLRAGSA